jgi:Fe(3+) dicitrate transport protein
MFVIPTAVFRPRFALAFACLALPFMAAGDARADEQTIQPPVERANETTGKPPIAKPRLSPLLDEITIIGDASDVATTAGSAHVIDATRLEQFKYTDVQRIVREIPGVSVQVEDGYGLRPNLSIRGTATERSARITLLEDNVLIAPAPYSAPSAYYFPTAARMHQVEVLKGSSSIKQGPYTVGGSMNFISTPIPQARAGFLDLEAGENETTRVHAVFGDRYENFGFLVETNLWDSAGFQDIDFADTDTGLNKDDWMVKFRVNSDATANVYQQLDVKLQYAREKSNQSYLGLTDSDFGSDPYRRYGASRYDNIETVHEQVIVRYLAEISENLSVSATVYSNQHERDWFKTEGVDPDGSLSAESFDRTSWYSVVQAVNRGDMLGSLGPAELESILNGSDTAVGSIQIRSNAREYFSRGIQLAMSWDTETGSTSHAFEFGIRIHEDEEDRLQRNSNYHQENGELLLDDLGLLGNAGNRVQSAEATSFFVYDEITIGDLTLTPGLRYEDIDQQRTRWETRDGMTSDPGSRDPSNLRDTRSNRSQVWIPGLGALYAFNDTVALYGGIHKGFTAPSNAPGVAEEQSINYELGLRYSGDRTYIDSAVFFTDYDNLLGECTSSSGAECEVGDAFNGDAASVLGLEILLTRDLVEKGNFSMPLTLSYTYLDATFDSDIADTIFFGDVSKGDPLPYIPNHQFLASIGFQTDRFGSYLNANYVDQTCVKASCGEFETTDNILTLDISANYQFSEHINFYGRVNNLTDDQSIVARHPYGARPNLGRTAGLGIRISL